MNDIAFQKNYSIFIGPTAAAAKKQAETGHAQNADKNGKDFKGLLSQELQKAGDVTFSKHAVTRMSSRKIEVSPQLLEQIGNAMTKAGEKGIRDALILNGGTAFIVNIPNRTVVTTISGHEMTENVFTNIDGAVILKPDLL